MSNLAVRLLMENLRTLAFGSISGTYAAIGGANAPFLNPIRLMYIVNTTDVLLTFSDDGVNDKFVLASGSHIIIDVTTNHTFVGGAFTISQGQKIYVKGSPSVGSVYLSVFYGGNG